MEVILTQDVDALGLAGQVVNVAKGYARNKLIPGNLALIATPKNLKLLEKKRADYEQRALKEKERAQLMARQLEEVQVTISQKAGEKDKLYGSVTPMDVAAALSEQGIDVDRRKLKMTEPIKTLGDHEVVLKLHPEVSANIKVSVVRAE